MRSHHGLLVHETGRGWGSFPPQPLPSSRAKGSTPSGIICATNRALDHEVRRDTPMRTLHEGEKARAHSFRRGGGVWLICLVRVFFSFSRPTTPPYKHPEGWFGRGEGGGAGTPGRKQAPVVKGRVCVAGDPNRPFRCHPGEDLGLSRSCSWFCRPGVWSPPYRSLPHNLCNPPHRCRVRR